jgi:uncharacterized protein (TIGR03437 family)
MKTKTVLQMIVIVTSGAGSLAAAPHIASVVNSADFAVGIPLGSFGTVYGTGLSDAVYSSTVYPFPVTLGPTQAAICPLLLGKLLAIPSACVPLALTYASPTQINFVAPLTLPPASQGFANGIAVVVSVSGTVDDGASSGTNGNQQLGLGGASPRLFVEGYDCFIDSRYQDADKNCGLSWIKPPTYAALRGAVTDLNGNLITSANPAHLNQYLVVWASGMGQTKTPNSAAWLFNIPVYGSTSDSYEPIDALYAGESSFPGLFQINIQVPAFIATGFPGYYPPFPCGNYAWEVSLSAGTANNIQSNLVQVPIVVKNGDVPCSP